MKPIFKSRTALFNFSLLLAPLLPGAAGESVRAFITANPEGAAAVVGVVNLVLRWVTKDKLTLL